MQQHLKTIRASLGMSEWGLALRAGISEGAVVRYEQGYSIAASEKRALTQALFDARLERAQKRSEDRRIVRATRELRQLRKVRR
jgi:predicted transcriptional regulator